MGKNDMRNKQYSNPSPVHYRVVPDHYSNFDSTANEWRIEVHLPGVKKEDINLRILPDLYSLETKRDERRFYSLTEYFPFTISPDSVQAKYESGLLIISGKIKDPLEKAYEIKIE
jgi:HSP20 family molecular chaperone IbpA